MYEFGTSKDVPVMQFRRYKPFSILLNWTYMVVFCLLYILLFMHSDIIIFTILGTRLALLCIACHTILQKTVFFSAQ